MSGNQLSISKYFIFGIFHTNRHSTFVASSVTITYRRKENSNNISIETSNKWKYLNSPHIQMLINPKPPPLHSSQVHHQPRRENANESVLRLWTEAEQLPTDLYFFPCFPFLSVATMMMILPSTLVNECGSSHSLAKLMWTTRFTPIDNSGKRGGRGTGTALCAMDAKESVVLE